jgi:hypothetical protein
LPVVTIAALTSEYAIQKYLESEKNTGSDVGMDGMVM